jgi:hypothetical protein
MKLFGASIWKTVQAEIPSIDVLLGGLKTARNTTTNRDGSPKQLGTQEGAVTYQLTPNFVRTFAMSGLPFMAFYEFNDLTGWCRDTYFAPDHVEGYDKDIGTKYTVWTHDATSAYRRHIFLDELSEDITISFEIPSLKTVSSFPLRIRLYDKGGLYFQHDQKLVVERIHEDRTALTSWKKIPQLRDSLQHLHARTCAGNEDP